MIVRIKKESAPYYLQIAADLRAGIAAGNYAPGQPLPTENDLMRQWRVSRVTVRSALKLLCRDGVIYRLPAKGTFVNDPQAQALALLKTPPGHVQPVGLKIGLLVPCVTAGIFTGIVRGVEDALEAAGCNLLLGNFDGNPDKERKYIQSFIRARAAGLIVTPSAKSNTRIYAAAQRAGAPLVFLDTYPENIAADAVQTDNVAGGIMGVKRLAAAGCRRIGFICGGWNTSSSQERLAGYRLAVLNAGRPLDDGLAAGSEFDNSSAYQVAVTLLRRGADGLLLANGNLITGVMQAAADTRADTPVVAFDEIAPARGLPPPLAWIIQPAQKIGYLGARILLRRISENSGNRRAPREPAHKACLPPTLVEARPASASNQNRRLCHAN